MPGAVCYEITSDEVPVRGHLIPEDDVSIWAGPVQAILNDDAGVAEAQEALEDLASTTFASSILDAVLSMPESQEEWRVGEAVAQHFLADELGHSFPWPDSRSTRNLRSSSGGVDLIGIGKMDGVWRFVLCEVKTSHEQAWPPGVATSRSHGLRSQLTGLLENDDRSVGALRYLLMNSFGKSWFADVKAAMATYLDSAHKVCVIGVLVHVAAPDVKDLAANASALEKTRHTHTDTRLFGIYPHAGVLSLIAGADVSIETAA